MKRTGILFIVSALLVVFALAFTARDINNTNVLYGPCTQKICVTDTAANYLPGVLIQVDSAGVVVDTCVTSSNGCCDVTVEQGGTYTARAPQYDSAPPVEFMGCRPKPVRIIIY